jgi:hypothetical protein
MQENSVRAEVQMGLRQHNFRPSDDAQFFHFSPVVLAIFPFSEAVTKKKTNVKFCLRQYCLLLQELRQLLLRICHLQGIAYALHIWKPRGVHW